MSNDRLGYYLVGWKKFYNKTLALIESKKTNYQVLWIFHDNVYSKIDWTIPIEQSLSSIYKNRAQQLREKYDYLILNFSGGADSTNILLTFLDNNIFLDEIVMQVPGPDVKNLNAYDTSSRNLHGEILYAAVPFLKNLQNKIHPNTKIRIQDFSKSISELFSKDNWFETNPVGCNVAVNVLGKQQASMFDPHTLELCYSGKKCCQILGIDKPLVKYNNGKYYAYFTDSSAYHVTPLAFNHKEIFHSLYVTEFFYWTPDMPEIVVKQAQEIKRACEQDPTKKLLWSQSSTLHIETYRGLMHPIIYPKYDTFPKFQTEKAKDLTLITPYNQWFFESADKRRLNNYLDVISYLKTNISKVDCINGDIQSGMASTVSNFYEI